jgi:hypothetical protein
MPPNPNRRELGMNEDDEQVFKKNMAAILILLEQHYKQKVSEELATKWWNAQTVEDRRITLLLATTQKYLRELRSRDLKKKFEVVARDMQKKRDKADVNESQFQKVIQKAVEMSEKIRKSGVVHDWWPVSQTYETPVEGHLDALKIDFIYELPEGSFVLVQFGASAGLVERKIRELDRFYGFGLERGPIVKDFIRVIALLDDNGNVASDSELESRFEAAFLGINSPIVDQFERIRHFIANNFLGKWGR